MITTTEFLLFSSLMLAVIWGFFWKNEAKKSHRLIIALLENDEIRERMAQEFRLVKKSIFKEV